ncbi:MAG: acyltransferase family protein [Bacteroidia bacterium]
MNTQKEKHLYNLTGLRFIAALFVMLQHLNDQCVSIHLILPFNKTFLFHSGQEGVYVFFVLSGYLIYKRYSFPNNSFKISEYKPYLINRFARIYPLFLLVFILGIILVFAVDVKSFKNLLPFIPLYLIGFSNVVPLFDLSFIGPLLSLWTIGTELQFYFLFPFLVKTIKSKGIFIIWVGLFVFYFLSFINGTTNFFHFLRFDYFFAGVLAAYYSNKSVLIVAQKLLKVIFLRINYFFKLVLFWFTFCVFIIIPFYISILVFRETLLLFSIPIFIIILGFDIRFPFLNSKITIMLGSISYGLYVYHPIISYPLRKFFLMGWFSDNMTNNQLLLIYSVLLFVSTVIISYISFVFFENYCANKIVLYFKKDK